MILNPKLTGVASKASVNGDPPMATLGALSRYISSNLAKREPSLPLVLWEVQRCVYSSFTDTEICVPYGGTWVVDIGIFSSHRAFRTQKTRRRHIFRAYEWDTLYGVRYCNWSSSLGNSYLDMRDMIVGMSGMMKVELLTIQELFWVIRGMGDPLLIGGHLSG